MNSVKLQILIPQYNETDDIIKPLLTSISLQQSIDFKEISVIICNDGSSTYLTDSFLKSFPYKIDYYKEPHKGISATRNFCFDKATAEYVMFCDADDMFCCNLGLYTIFIAMNSCFDSFVSLLVEELKNEKTNTIYYKNREMDGIFVHGKVFRRQYLIDNNIKFDTRLNVCCEDSYFISLCLSISNNIYYSPIPIYLWKYREGSISHRDPNYEKKAYKYIIQSNELLLDDLISRNIIDKASIYAASLVINIYSAIKDPDLFRKEDTKYIEDIKKLMFDWVQKYRYLYDTSSFEEKRKILNYVYDEFNPLDTDIALTCIDSWLNNL